MIRRYSDGSHDPRELDDSRSLEKGSRLKDDGNSAGPYRMRRLDAGKVLGRPEEENAGRDECTACRRRRRRRSLENLLGTADDRKPSIPSPGRSPRKPGALQLHPLTLSALSIVFFPTTYAAPPPNRPMAPLKPPTFHPYPTTQARHPRRSSHPISSITSSSGTTATSVSVVDETAMPYVLTQVGDGTWSKIDNAWYLYGRQAGVPDKVLADGSDPTASPIATATASSSTASWAIEAALPAGWGQTSNRTSFYKVPLIVVASVILAVGISIGIILCPSPLPLLTQLTRRSIVFSRRKANRKQKRRAERLRRKALAAAGLSEDNVKGSAAETAFKEKLAGLEQQHVARRGKEDRSSFVKVKVRKWHRGLRRRKGKPKDEEPEIEVIEEDESAATVNEVITPTLRRRSTESMILAGTRGSPRLMDELPLSPTGEVVVNREEAIGEGPHLARSTTYFPPAYRPASVRSYRISDPHAGTGPSRSAGTSAIAAPALDALPTAEEKTRASGYYPAPATHDIEVALAVASRSDGKGRASVPNIDEEDEERARMRHIATDDKRILEQLRLGASAPLMSPVGEYSTADGPSAPDVEVDEQGFERPTEDIFDLPELFRPPPQSFDVESMGDILPAPPRMVPHRSFRMSVDIDSSAEPEPFDELHLVPSAPPTTGIADAPSAPPMMDDDDAPAPSAPPLALEKKDEDSNPEGMSSCDHISRSRSPVQGNSAEVSSPNSAVTGGGAFSALAQTTLGQPVFSPRYAP